MHFIGGVGWTFYRVATDFFIGDEKISEEEDWRSGLNVNSGLTYDLSPRWFMGTQFDLILLTGDRPDSVLGLVKIGGGFRF